MSGDGDESTDGEGKEHVKLQLHDITERMSKLLCHYEGDKEDTISKKRKTNEKNVGRSEEKIGEEDEEGMKEGLMDVLMDFHEMANAREDLLETLMTWFQGSSEILSAADHEGNPEQSWMQIEQEMEQLLSTVESFQQPSKIADIERRLLGVVLREENIKKIEQIRDEFNVKRLDDEEAILDAENSAKEDPGMLFNRNESRKMDEKEENPIQNGDTPAQDKECISGILELIEKEVQVDLLEQTNIIQEVAIEIENASMDDEKAIVTNACTQTDILFNFSKFQPSKDCSDLYLSDSSLEKIEHIDYVFIDQTEQEDTKLHSMQTNEITCRKESIEIIINSKIQGITIEETEKSCVDSDKNYNSIPSKVQQSKSTSSVEIFTNMQPEVEIGMPEKMRFDGEKESVALLPRLKCNQKTDNNRKTRLSGNTQKSNNLYKVHFQVGEFSRHKVYMHLPVATTGNRGLGLIPPIKKRSLQTDEGLLRAFQQGMLVSSHDSAQNTAKSNTTPLPVNLNSEASSMCKGNRVEVKRTNFSRETGLISTQCPNTSLMTSINSVRKRAVTIH